MAKAKKQKNGSWRVQVYDYTDENGKNHRKSFTAATKAQAEYLANEFKYNRPTPAERKAAERERNMPTVEQAVWEYIEMSRDVLAPATIRGYETIARSRFRNMLQTKISDLSDDFVQNEINIECRLSVRGGERINPKTVCSAWGLISSALKRYNKTFNVRLPKKIKKIKDFPDPAEIFAAVKGTDIELPCLLAMWLSLSISEIEGLNCSSVRDGILRVERVRIYLGGEVTEKPTGKVDTRIRNQQIPDYIQSLINCTDTYKKYAESAENGPLIGMQSYQIYKRWKKICAEHGWEMTFHDLRAVSASIGLYLGVPDRYMQERGGWKTDRIMKTVYQQTFSKGRLEADARFNNYFESIIEAD